jgi:hypothetical protein
MIDEEQKIDRRLCWRLPFHEFADRLRNGVVSGGPQYSNKVGAKEHSRRKWTGEYQHSIQICWPFQKGHVDLSSGVAKFIPVE